MLGAHMRALPAAAVLLLLALPPALAQEGDARVLHISEVEKVEALTDPEAGEAYALLGDLSLEVAGAFSLRARRMVVWLDPDADATVFDLVQGLSKEGHGLPLWAARAVYAEGAETFPAVFQVGGHVFRCSSFFYDFQRHTGVLLDAMVRLRRQGDRALAPDLVVRAKRFLTTKPGEWRASDVTLFSSNLHDTEVRVHVREVTLKDPGLAQALGHLIRISARDYRGGEGPTRAEVDEVLGEIASNGGMLEPKRLRLSGVRATFFNVPFFGWNALDVKGADMVPLRAVAELGSIGSLGDGFRLGGGLMKRPFGFIVAGGYIESRGVMVDGTFVTDAFDGRVKGTSFGVWLNDHGTDFGVPPLAQDRYWTHNQYRWLMSDTWRMDFEYDDLSDPTFLRLYDEGEFKEGKVQESYVYLRRRGEQSYFTFLYRWRTIPFEDYVEQLPGVRYELPVTTLLRLGENAQGEPVMLQLAGGIEVANLRYRASDLGPGGDFRTVRFAMDPTLYVSFTAGPFRIVPFTTLGFIGYEETLDTGSASRFTAGAGIRIDTQFSRWFGKVRHIVNLSLEYEDLFTVDPPPGDFFVMDDLDATAPWEGVSLRWRNRLQRRKKTGGLETFLTQEFYFAWFPEGEQPLGKRGDWFLDMEWEWLVTEHLWTETRFSLDPTAGNTASFEFWYQVSPALFLNPSIRYLENDSDVLTLAADYMVQTRWRLVGFSQWDIRNEEILNQGLLVQRLGKTAALGFRVSWSPGPDDWRFTVKLDLIETFFARRRKERETLRHEVGWR